MEFKTDEDLDHAIRQIVDGAVTPEGVIDIFEMVGVQKPDLSILSEEFLQGIKSIPQKNLAIEVL